jgi:hypothetical protein
MTVWLVSRYSSDMWSVTHSVYSCTFFLQAGSISIAEAHVSQLMFLVHMLHIYVLQGFRVFLS